MSNPLTKKLALRWTAISLLSIVVLYFLLPVAKPLFKEEYSTVVQAQDGSILHVFTNKNEQWHLPPDTITIPEKLKTATIVFEDESFYKHPGVNLQAIFRAVSQNTKEGKIKSGASTIPMQIARMARPKKTDVLQQIQRNLPGAQTQSQLFQSGRFETLSGPCPLWRQCHRIQNSLLSILW